MAARPARVYSDLCPMAVSTNSASTRCVFGLFEFDPRTGELTREGRAVKLSPQPARVLARLLERPGDLVLREELRDLLWGQDTFVDFERGLNFSILQVRTALGDSSENPRFVQTVPRRGYRFIAPVALSGRTPAPPSLLDLPAPSTSAHAPVAGERRHALAVSRRAIVIVSAVALASMVWLLVAARRTSTPAAPAPTADRIRLVVLPVANLTGGEDGDLVADGLTDAIIAELGQLSPRRLAVIARTSAMSYRNAPRPLPEIGRTLNVAFIVETSLRREHGALRVNSQVVPVADQTPLASLSETFGGDASAASSESQVAIRVARFVAGALLAADHAPTMSRPYDRTAWSALVRGRARLHRGTPEDVERAIAEFDTAAAADPSLAAAWAAGVEARHLRVMMGIARPREAYPAARVAADRARAADPALSDAHLADGLVTLWFDRDPAVAAAAFARALELNASSAAAHHDYAWALLALGRDEEAIAHITTARDLDPLSARANTDIGWLYLQLNRPADAERACQHTLAIHPQALEPQACLERAYAARGLWEPALQAARSTVPADVFRHAGSAGGPAETRLRALWQWRLERLEDAARARWISPYTLAVQHALVGQADRALAQLARAREEQVGMLLFLSRDPALEGLRADPRFTALLMPTPAK